MLSLDEQQACVPRTVCMQPRRRQQKLLRRRSAFLLSCWGAPADAFSIGRDNKSITLRQSKADLVDNCGFAESDGRWACWLGSTPHPDIPRPMENLLLSGRLKLAEVARR